MKIDLQRPDESTPNLASKIIKGGGIVSFPTDTLYALGADATSEQAIKQLYKLKRKDRKEPVAIFIRNLEEANSYVEEVSLTAQYLMEEFWPGPLTLIFKSNSEKLRPILSETDKLGIRLSPNKFVTSLLERSGVPITATSANISGRRASATASGVRYYFNNRIELILDGGRTENPLPSTVVDVSSEQIVLLRAGALPVDRLKSVLPRIKIQKQSPLGE